MLTSPISATEPTLTCLHSGSDILADENTPFNMSLTIVDQKTLVPIPDINWNVK